MEFVRSDKPSSLGAIFDKEAEAGRTAAAADQTTEDHQFGGFIPVAGGWVE